MKIKKPYGDPLFQNSIRESWWLLLLQIPNRSFTANRNKPDFKGNLQRILKPMSEKCSIDFDHDDKL